MMCAAYCDIIISRPESVPQLGIFVNQNIFHMQLNENVKVKQCSFCF